MGSLYSATNIAVMIAILLLLAITIWFLVRALVRHLRRKRDERVLALIEGTRNE